MFAKKKKRSINLLVAKEAEKDISSQVLSWGLTWGRYVIILTQIVVLCVFFARFKLDRDHADLKESVDQKQSIIASISDLEEEIQRVQRNMMHISDILGTQDDVLRILNFFQDSTPVDTVFLTLTIKPDILRFSARATSLASFNTLLRKLSQSQQFSEITLEDIQRRQDGKIEYALHLTRVHGTPEEASVLP